MADEWDTLSSGVQVVTHVSYTPHESRGPLALVITSGISLCAVISILVAMAISGFKTNHQFIRTQVGAYFLSLVVSDLLQATGSVMNAKWVVIRGVSTGPFCTTQAVLKQSGNVGTALWSLVIAVHTFCLLFLRVRIGDHIFYATLVGVWLFLGFVVMMGPVIIQSSAKGPFWGISGYWCWITDAYSLENLTDEYLFMFITAAVSFVLYSLIFLRLRGNLQGFGSNMRCRRVKEPWAEEDADESQMSIVGKQMLWYPVAYTFIILPISICRWSSLFKHEVPYSATMAADSVFMLSGFVNAILYSTTRKIVSIPSLLPFARLIHVGSSRPTHTQEVMRSKSSLNDMEFSVPAVPASSLKRLSAKRMWHSQSGSFPDHAPKSHLSLPGLYNIDNGSELSDLERTVEHNAPSAKQAAATDKSPPSPTIATRARSLSEPHADSRFSLPRTKQRDDVATDDPSGATPQREPSDKSLTTDGAPSLHRKRFSGWSFPSVRGLGTASQEDEEVHTDLESMRFASPSPHPSPPKATPCSRSSSAGDLQIPRWPPRVEPLPDYTLPL